LPWFLRFSQKSAVFFAIFCRDFLLSLSINKTFRSWVRISLTPFTGNTRQVGRPCWHSRSTHVNAGVLESIHRGMQSLRLSSIAATADAVQQDIIRQTSFQHRCTVNMELSARICSWHWLSISSGACLRRRSRCHEFPPSRSVLSTSLHSRQSKVHRSQVGLHGSEPGLPWMTNPLTLWLYLSLN